MDGLRFWSTLVLLAFVQHVFVSCATISVVDTQDVVNNDNLCSLREAIENVNGASHSDCATPGGDNPAVISLPGTVTAGNLPAVSRNLLIQGSNSVVAAGATGTIFTSSAELTFRGVTVKDGTTITPLTGGCITIADGGSLVMENSALYNCRAEIRQSNVSCAGGAYLGDSTLLSLEQTTISANWAESDNDAMFAATFSCAGGIRVGADSNVDMSNTDFLDNIGESGGAIWAESPVLCSNCAFEDNHAELSSGGAILSFGNVTVSGGGRASVHGNSAADFGGFVAADGDVTITDYVEITSNSADTGSVASSTIGFVQVSNIDGDVSHNSATFGALVGYDYAFLGDISGNVNNNDGGVLVSEIQHGILTNIEGSIFNNVGSQLSLCLSSTFCEISNTGDIYANAATVELRYLVQSNAVNISNVGAIYANVGGFAAIENDLTVTNVNGNISSNVGYRLFSAAGFLHIENVEEISGNVFNDTIAFAVEHIEVQQVQSIIKNSGNLFRLFGNTEFIDTLFVPYVIIANISGNISENIGGIAYSNGTLLISDVGGSLSDNVCQGSCLTSANETVVSNIAGGIFGNRGNLFSSSGSNTRVSLLSGIFENNFFGMFLVANDLLIENLSSGIFENEIGAFFIEAENAIIKNIDGSIEANHADSFFMRTASNLNVQDISGCFCHNSAGDGMLLSGNSLNVFNVSGIFENSATSLSAVGYAGGAVQIHDIFGSISNNRLFGGLNSGAVLAYSDFGEVEIFNIHGNISQNLGDENEFGLFRANASSVFIRNVAGSIRDNVASNGISRALASAVIENIAGSISNNFARAGSLVEANTGFAVIRNISGSIDYNLAHGGLATVATGGDYVLIDSIDGSISYNIRTDPYGNRTSTPLPDQYAFNPSDGVGVAHSDSGSVLISNIGGHISWNQGRNGGVASAFEDVRLENITGSISYNSGAFAGAVYSSGTVSIVNVASIVGNEADLGCSIARGVNHITVHSVAGGILDNLSFRLNATVPVTDDSFAFAREAVGAFVSDSGAIEIRAIGGAISGNYGGNTSFARAFLDVIIENVNGDISDNRAFIGAGIAASNTGSVFIQNINGSISRNAATRGVGSIADGFAGVLIEHINGDISYNRDDVALDILSLGNGAPIMSVNGPVVLRNITGSLYSNSGALSGLILGVGVEINDVHGGIIENYGYRVAVAMSQDKLEINTVHGSISGNHVKNISDASSSSGFLAVGDVKVFDIFGDISQNMNKLSNDSSPRFGVFASTNGDVYIHDVAGSFFGNHASIGAVAYAAGDILCENIHGSFYENIAYNDAALLYALGSATLRNINGSISANFGATSSLIRSESALVHDIHGDIFGNIARLGSGIWSQSRCEVFNVFGSIYQNQAVEGGLLHSLNVATLHDVHGNIHSNSAVFGGVVYAGGEAVVANVNGSISKNAVDSDGGVLYAGVTGRIENVQGRIYDNRARGSGGVIFASQNVAELQSVIGNIEANVASYGGVLASSGIVGATISDISGSILQNTALISGAVLSSDVLSGQLVIERVNGHIENNVATSSGGVIYGGRFGIIRDLIGNIVNNLVGNATHSAGGVVRSESVLLTNITGDICSNSAYDGGVGYAAEEARISSVIGDVCNNLAHNSGSILFGRSAIITNITGSITRNTASGSGALVSDDFMEISYIIGDISYNHAHQGGVTYCASCITEISQITGNIVFNTAETNGGVIYSIGSSLSTIEYINGTIANNKAIVDGGVIYSESEATIAFVTGNVELNTAQFNGGVVAAHSIATISNITGNIQNNDAHLGSGGVVFTINNFISQTVIQNIDGNVCHNHAFLSGGVVSSEEVLIDYVAGDLCHNSASENGGVVSSNFGGVAILNVQGFINGNTAISGDGGVVYSLGDSDVDILDTQGGICSNSAVFGGVVFSNRRNVEIVHEFAFVTHNFAEEEGSVIFLNNTESLPVQGSVVSDFGYVEANTDDTPTTIIDGNSPFTPLIVSFPIASYTFTIVEQPQDAIANEPMVPGPVVSVNGGGASSGAAAFFGLQIDPVGPEPPYRYPHPVEVENLLANSSHIIRNIVLPSGEYELLIELYLGCEEGDVSHIVRSDPFTASACRDPAPVVCPVSEYFVEANTFTCSAFVEVEDPTASPECDTAVFSNSFNGRSHVASDKFESYTSSDFYPVGVTEFDLTVSGSQTSYDCPVTVTVVDTTPPLSVDCTDPIRVPTTPGQCVATTSIGVPSVVDNCPISVISNNYTTNADASGVYPLGLTAVNFTVENTGPRGSCATTVEVVDLEAPVFVCPNSVTTECNSRNVSFTVSVTDNCDPINMTSVTTNLPSGVAFPPGITNQFYTAEDSAGNYAQCSFSVTVQTTYYEDADGDGVGTGPAQTLFCNAPPGFVTVTGDCNDQDPSIQALFFLDFDGDGFADQAKPLCLDSQGTIPPHLINPNATTANPTQVIPASQASVFDCNDSDVTIFPGTTEVCDGLDNNCNGEIDEGLVGCVLPTPLPSPTPVPTPSTSPPPAPTPVVSVPFTPTYYTYETASSASLLSPVWSLVVAVLFVLALC